MTVFGNLSDIHANANVGIDVVRSGAYDYVRSTTGQLESVLWAGAPFDAATALFCFKSPCTPALPGAG